MLAPIIKTVGEIAISQAPKLGSFAIKHSPKVLGVAAKHIPKIGISVVASQAPKIISKVANNPWGMKPTQWNARILICVIAGVIKSTSGEMMKAALLLMEWINNGKVSLKVVQKIIRQIIDSTPNIPEAAMIIFKQILDMKS